ncbi:hypothetical protein [Dyella sp. A6]|nr:hypothetical protein [Dyella sp. A6]
MSLQGKRILPMGAASGPGLRIHAELPGTTNHSLRKQVQVLARYARGAA